jgi:hypothetical protein
MKISTFTLNGIDIDLTYRKGALAYTFNVNDNSYGYKIDLKKKGVMDVASATFLLLTNALETYEAVKKLNDSK